MNKFYALLFFFICNSFLNAQTPIVKKDVSKLYGIADKKTGIWLTKPTYKQIIEQYSDSLKKKLRCFIAYNKKDVAVLIDKSGKKIISQKFDYVGIIDKKLPYVVSFNKKYSFYSPENNILQKTGWVDDYTFPFEKQKKSIVKLIKGNRFCFIDLNNSDTAIFSYDNLEISNFNQYDTLGYCIVRQNNKYGIINYFGKQTIPCVYDTLFNQFNLSNELSLENYYFKSNSKWGICNFKNEILISPKYEAIDSKMYKYFLINNISSSYIPVKIKSKWGLIDSSEKFIIKNDYDTILKLYKESITVKKNGKMGIIDFKENIIFPFLYDYIESTDIDFHKKKTSKTYLANNGCTICHPDSTGGLWGLVDSRGKIIQPIDANFIKLYRNYSYSNSEYEGFEDSTLIGYIWNRGGEKKQILLGADTVEMQDIDVNGAEYYVKVWKTNYSHIIKGGKSGVISIDGKEIIPVKYDDLSFTMYNDAVFYGTYISQPHKLHATSYLTDYKDPIYCKLSNKYGIIDWKLNTIMPIVYDSLELKYNNVSEITIPNDTSSSTNTLSLIKEVYVGYLKGDKYYYSTAGKQMGIIEKDIVELQVLNFYDTLGKRPFEADYILATKDAKIDTFSIYTINSTIDYNGNEIEVKDYTNFYIGSNGKYNLIDPQTHKYILPNWADDLMFCPQSSIDSIRFNKHLRNANEQLDFFYETLEDSIFNSNHNIYKTYPKNYEPYKEYFGKGRLYNVFWFKQNNLWYLFDVFLNRILNPTNGYDSILFNGKNWVATKNNTIDLYSLSCEKQK